MEIFAILVGLVGIGVGAAIYVRSANQAKEMSERRAELEGRLSHLESRRKKAERRIEEITERAKRLERDLAEAIERRDEKAVAHALWNLEVERSDRQWRDVVVPARGLGDPDDSSTGRRLSFAIQQEVERLREEVGVSIRFEGDLDCELEPETALACLRISEELLAAASKNADDVSVVVDQGDEPSVSIQFLCTGWVDGDALEQSELGSSVKAMARRLDGWVRFEQPERDDLTVAVRLPADAAAQKAEDEGPPPPPVIPAEMTMASAAFLDKTPIPDRHAKDNENISPPMQWSDPPEGTVELALTCHDPDAESTFVHWLVAGIDPTCIGADEGKPPPGAIEGVNGYGETSYGGPRPPKGEGAHRYFFRIHACSKALGLKPGFTDEDLQRALAGAEIAKATVMGTYERS